MRTVEVTDELQAYLDGLVPKRDQVLARMEEEAHRENIPIVDPHEGMLLYLLVKIAGAKRVLELGTATGYSGIWLLRGTDGGSLTTFEVDHKRAERARANFSDAGLGKQALVLEQRLNPRQFRGRSGPGTCTQGDQHALTSPTKTHRLSYAAEDWESTTRTLPGVVMTVAAFSA